MKKEKEKNNNQSKTAMTVIFKFSTGLGGFHMDSNMVIWKAYIGQKVPFKRKHNTTSNRFAVANIFLLKEQTRAASVGYIPKELSQYTWYGIQKGGKFRATVYNTKAKPWPLIQCRLDVQIKAKIVWPQEKSFRY